MLTQLVYVSHRTPTCTEEEIQKILNQCQHNNKGEDITGVLLYSNTHFLQYLEGDYKRISTLYDKIKQDKRHKRAVMVSTTPIKGRSFPSWQMAGKKFDDQDLEFKTELKPHEQKVFKSLLEGEDVEGHKALSLIKKFFK